MRLQYIEDFKKLGLGIFVHYGLYSQKKKGEWFQYFNKIDRDEYKKYINTFKVSKSWARNLVRAAKKAGAKYITITTRHHDGFSLYDTCGLNDFDAPHSPVKRDLIKEFVEECRKENIVPFFYHTLLDWHNKDYVDNFPAYIDYLIKSVEIICKNYGPIGGLWFDGYWDKPNENWQFDRLYKTIRKYQPEAMIINNTGVDDLGRVTHYDIDAVTFERGKPAYISDEDGKSRAGEVCDSITDHWAYTENDISFKSVSFLVEELMECRHYGCNLLLNVGPLPNGELRPIEKETLLEMGKWVKKYSHIIFDCRPSSLHADNAYIFEDNQYFYAVSRNVPLCLNPKAKLMGDELQIKLHTDKRIIGATYLDERKQKVSLDNKNHIITVEPFPYGLSFVSRVIRFKLK